jgi:hypothetical protein
MNVPIIRKKAVPRDSQRSLVAASNPALLSSKRESIGRMIRTAARLAIPRMDMRNAACLWISGFVKQL